MFDNKSARPATYEMGSNAVMVTYCSLALSQTLTVIVNNQKSVRLRTFAVFKLLCNVLDHFLDEIWFVQVRE